MTARILGYVSDEKIRAAMNAMVHWPEDAPSVRIAVGSTQIEVLLSKDRVKRLEGAAEALALEQLREDARKAGVTL